MGRPGQPVPQADATGPAVRSNLECGCSLGFEPFTIAMLAKEIAPHTSVYILATDLDETILSRAQNGIYTEQQMAGVSPSRRTRFFRKVDNNWEARPELQP